MEKKKIVNFLNLGGFVLYVVGRFGKFPVVSLIGLALIVVSMLITIFNRREFTKFEFWLAVVILIMLAIIGVMLLLL